MVCRGGNDAVVLLSCFPLVVLLCTAERQEGQPCKSSTKVSLQGAVHLAVQHSQAPLSRRWPVLHFVCVVCFHIIPSYQGCRIVPLQGRAEQFHNLLHSDCHNIRPIGIRRCTCRRAAFPASECFSRNSLTTRGGLIL